RNHRPRQTWPALSHQPGHRDRGLRHRSRAHRDGGRQGHRRVSHHQEWREAGGRGPARAHRTPATPAGGRRMKLLKAIIRPNKVDDVKDALAKLNLSGMTVTEVRGHGKQKGHTAVYRGKEYNVSLLPKMQIEVVVADSAVEDAIKAIVQAARTGEIGDG